MGHLKGIVKEFVADLVAAKHRPEDLLYAVFLELHSTDNRLPPDKNRAIAIVHIEEALLRLGVNIDELGPHT